MKRFQSPTTSFRPQHLLESSHLSLRLIALGALGLVTLAACSKKDWEKKSEITITAPEVAPPEAPPITLGDDLLGSMKPPLAGEFPQQKGSSPAMIELGQKLFFDTRLSKNHDISCNSCHGLETFGVDRKPVSDGHKAQKGGRNSPSVFNAAGHFVQFWDGRSPTVETQATGPVMNPVEMAMPDEKRVIATLESIPEYEKAFKKIFSKDAKPVSLKNAGIAIGAFERKLATPSRWDKFLAGDKEALTNEEKIGFKTFLESGCVACHSGTLVGGNTYQKLGAVKPWPNQADQGRFAETKVETDKMMFKVPSLRNVAETAPYFHDASATTLEEAVIKMGAYQLGREISGTDAASIATWLKSLTGEIPENWVKRPELPASTDKTPKPDPT